ncbi:alpha/beta fold hydrolase (plasmid) [Streptomyces sp. NBC_01471]|uniref:thioesterase II family protein n=1 Tax=Streptomyces sp. NBC_01471 TaxID=2903879 RepID=UPI002F912686
MPPPASSSWTALLRPAPHARRRLVVFPHAGAGPDSYASLLTRLPDDVEVLGVTLPGRERRPDEAPGTSPDAVAHGVAGELAERAPLPTVYFGHSLGALLAVATARARPGLCDGLVVSAAFPGSRAHPFPDLLESTEGLAAILARHRLPADALTAPGPLSGRERLLAHDLELTRRALVSVAGTCLPVPLTALAGTDDPIVPAATLPLWGGFTSGGFRCRLVEGGHYFPFLPAGRRALLAEIADALTAAPAYQATGT